MTETYITPEVKANLERLLAHYQSLLGLRDWDITIELAPAESIRGAAAANLYDVFDKSAVIYLPTEDSNSERDKVRNGREFLLVHELIHCLMEPFLRERGGDAEDIFIENCINALSRALVKLNQQRS